jgi:hypothetical protein
MTERSQPVLVVPAEMVPYLREGLHFKIGNAADAISEVVVQLDSQRGAGWHREPLEHFDRLRVLLDHIGWEDSDSPVEAHVDLREHRHAVLEALRVQVLVSEDQLRESARVDAERTAAGEPPSHEATTQRVRALREWVAAIEAQATTLDRAARG